MTVGPLATFRVGDLTVTPFVLGEIVETPRDWFADAPATVPAGQVRMPVICLHVAGEGCSVLVDACDPARYSGLGSGSTTIHTALDAAGIAPDAISHVILTHGHHDHFCGVWDDSVDRPSFPGARHVLSSQEWSKDTLTQDARFADGPAADPRPLEALYQVGLLDFDASATALPPEITLLEAPGETKGHRVVRLTSQSQNFFFLADLFHVPAELADFGLCPTWAESHALVTNRNTIAGLIQQSRGTFMCSHIGDVLSAGELRGKQG